MKKMITAVLISAMALTAVAKVRIAERVSDIDGDANITITANARVSSVAEDVQVSSQNNIWTMTVQSIFTTNAVPVTNNYTYSSSIVTNAQGSEVVTHYNVTSADNTAWLKPGDVLTMSGSTQTLYKVVLELDE